MSGYARYEEYQKTNHPFYEEIPTHWDMERIKFNSYVKGRQGWQNLRAEEYQDEGPFLITGAHFDDIGGVEWTRCYHVSEDRYQRDKDIWVQEQDVLMTKDGSIGKIAFIGAMPGKACLNSHLLIIRALDRRYDQRYLYHLLCSTCFSGFIGLRQTGTTFFGITQEAVEEFTLLLPTSIEQRAIAKFLDHEIAKTDTLILKQQQLINLLKEKRQAVISHAVTKGLNPYEPMKDSGIEWLGEVPEHWNVTRAKYVAYVFVPQRNKPDLNYDEGTYWVTMEDMKAERIATTSAAVSEQAAKAAGSKTLVKGSVIASCVGNFGISSINDVDVIVNQQLQAFIPFGIEAEYLRLLVEVSKPYFEIVGTAATIIYVNRQGFENLPVIVPPREEQKEIIATVTSRSALFSSLINKAELAIGFMQERRAALISAAVTGKIDVRNWQPEQAEISLEACA